MDFIIVDLQGFKDNDNRFIVKEFSLRSRNMKFHDIIKSPVKIKLNAKQKAPVKWLTRNFHGIDWDDGFITLKELRNILGIYLDNLKIFVKGEEKISWIKQIMKNDNLSCANLEAFGCDINLSNLRCKHDFVCRNHSHITPGKLPQCALANVSVLKKWYKENSII